MKIMELYNIVNLGIISSWLICMSFMLYKTLTTDKTFVFVIFNKKQLVRYWLFIIAIISICFYLFFIRIKNIGKVINIYDLWYYILDVINSLSWSILILLMMVGILGLIFVFLGMRLLYKNIHLRLLALYLYYYQYESFRDKLVGNQIDFLVDFDGYLISRVMFFTEKPNYLMIAIKIWPRSFYWLESKIYKFIIPFLIIFDIITQNGEISKVFHIFPWFFIYMLIRTAWLTFYNFFIPANTDFSNAVYKKFLVNGKIYRMAIIPDPKKFY